MDFTTLDYILRIVGRIAFFFLLLGVYRLWHMPLLQRHGNQFFVAVLILGFIGIVLTLFEYFTIYPFHVYPIAITFNVLSTIGLTILLHYRAWKIEQKVGSGKLHEYQDQMDKIIRKLKDV